MQRKICKEHLEKLERNTERIKNQNHKMDYEKIHKNLLKEFEEIVDKSELRIFDYKVVLHLETMNNKL